MKPLTPLRLARLKAGISSQYVVAEAIGSSQSQISLYEQGFREPTEEQKKALARLYGVDETELFPRE
jgi:transcriptional regulator with XRE-family HTH domain